MKTDDALSKSDIFGKDCTIWESFAIQGRVIWALILREVITSYGRHNIGFGWMFIEPMLFTIAITALWSMVGERHGSGIPLVAFGLTGYSCVLMWRVMPGRAESAVKMNRPLLFHRNVKVLDLFLARLFLVAGGAGMSFLMLGIFYTWIGWTPPPENILLVVVGWLMMFLFGVSLATFIGAFATKWHWIGHLWQPTSYILFPLSGACFLVDSVPVNLQKYVLLIPMVHGCECIRDGYFGSHFRAHYSLIYLGVFALVLLLVGLLVLKKISREVESF